jgi:hypothetical protein
MAAGGGLSAWGWSKKWTANDIGSPYGDAWWPIARCQGTSRGGEAEDAHAAAPLACATVLDVVHEQQRSGGTRVCDAEVRWGWKQDDAARRGK